MNKLKYYYGNESEQFSFFRIPKIIMKDKRFSHITNDAKILYGLMLDKMSLSLKNGWIDKYNRVYIIFTVETIMEELGCCRAKAVKCLSELSDTSGVGLIERVRRGQGKPDIIYVKNFVVDGNADKSELHSESEDSKIQNSEKQTSKSLESELLEVQKSDANNTEGSNTEDTTTTEDVVAAREIFKKYDLTEKDIRAILKVADNDISKCKAAETMLRAQKSHIGNLVGWIIKAIRDDYQSTGYSQTTNYSLYGTRNGSLYLSGNKNELRELEQMYMSQVRASSSTTKEI